MTNGMQINDEYYEQVELPNRTCIRLRQIRPDDKQHMVTAFENLSQESRYKRFLSAKKALSAKELRYFTEIDQYDHFALGALYLDENEKEIGIAGVARFIRLPADRECAEVGITVIDSAKRKGIGRHLLQRLIDAAIDCGIKRLRFECLAENQEVKQLIKKLNKHVKFEREHELLIAEIVISKATKRYPLEVIDDLTALIRAFSSEAFIIYSDLSLGMFKSAVHAVSEYTVTREQSKSERKLKQ